MRTVIARAPLRLPLAGGLTDLPAFLAHARGTTVSLALDAYVYAVLKPNRNGQTTLHLNQSTFFAESSASLPNALVRSVMSTVKCDLTGVDIYLFSDLPGSSGMGGSGAATAALTTALVAFLGLDIQQREAIRLATQAEAVITRNGGYHDAAIALLGGLQKIDYDITGVVDSEIVGTEELWTNLCSNMTAAWTGVSGPSAPPVLDISVNIEKHYNSLSRMAEISSLLGSLLPKSGLSRTVIALINENQTLKAKVVGEGYAAKHADLMRALGAAGEDVAAILPGAKLGSSIWMIGSSTMALDYAEAALSQLCTTPMLVPRPAAAARALIF